MWMDESKVIGIGRFVVARPSDFVILTQSYKFDGNTLKTSRNKSILEFKHVIEKREKYLREQRRRDDTAGKFENSNIPWLEDARSPTADTRVLTYRKFEDLESPDIYQIEGYAYLGSTMFSWTFNADPRKLPLAIASNASFAQNIKLRENSDIPSEPGFCFDGGFVASKEGIEWARAYFKRPDTPGSAIFGIEMRPRLKSDDKLLDRVPTLVRMLANLATYTRTLRSGDRTVAGMPGEELLIKIKANGITAYKFIWEFQGRDDDDDGPISLANPNTRIELRVGGAKTGEDATSETSVLTEEETLALWEALLAGFQLRPGAV